MTTILDVLTQDIPCHSLREVNAGGCGLFAQALRQEILNSGDWATVHCVNHGYSSVFVRRFIDKWGQDINSALINSVDLGDRNQPHGHIVVMYEGHLYDSSGCVSGRFSTITDDISIEALGVLIDRGPWNTTFKMCNRELPNVTATLQAHVKQCFAPLNQGSSV